MKNIFIIDEYISSQKNGIGTFLRELLFCFKDSDNKVNLISFNAGVDEFSITKEKEITNYLFPVFKYGHFLEHYKIIEKFFRLYIQDSMDNVFFINHSPSADFIESIKNSHPLSKVIFTIHDFGWTGLLLGDLEEYKRIIKHHNDNEANDIPALNIFHQEKRMYEAADRIICLSVDTYNILRTVYQIPENKIVLIPNGLRFSRIRRSLNGDTKKNIRLQKRINENEKILLFIGRPTMQKGVFELINAMSHILKEFPSAKLVIVGDGNEVSMKEIVNASSQVASSVIVTGQLNRKEVQEWLSIADVGIISSYYEQCSYTAIEMMMYGLPIVASDGLGVRNMFVNEINAIMAKIENRKKPNEYQKNLVKSIINILSSPDLSERLGKGAQKTYYSNYTDKKMKINYKKLIEAIR